MVDLKMFKIVIKTHWIFFIKRNIKKNNNGKTENHLNRYY